MTVKEMKKIDNALVSYGQFLKKYVLKKDGKTLRQFSLNDIEKQ